MTSKGVILDPEFVRERIERADALTRAGFFASEIAVKLGVHPRTVERYRARARKEPAR